MELKAVAYLKILCFSSILAHFASVCTPQEFGRKLSLTTYLNNLNREERLAKGNEIHRYNILFIGLNLATYGLYLGQFCFVYHATC